MHYDEDMLYVKQMGEGDVLYHYTTIDALLSIVKYKKIWATKWDYLNDKDEFRVAIEVYEAVLKDILNDDKIIQDIKNQVDIYRNSENGLDDFFVISFSIDGDSQLLWSNYSNNDGANIEINFKQFERSIDTKIKWHGLVEYEKKQQKDCIKRTLEDSLNNLKEELKIQTWEEISELKEKDYMEFIDYIAVTCIVYSMFFKRECFKNEQEYRFVFSLSDRKNKEIKHRRKSNLIIPYIEQQYESIDFISGITAGPMNNIDVSARSIKEFFHNFGRDVHVKPSEIPLRY